jgi:hypothetical protein
VKRILLAAALLSAAVLVTMSPPVASQEVSILVLGPDAVAVGSNVTYNVTVGGGPAEQGGTYNVTAYLDGPEVTGATPSRSQPYSNESSRTTYSIDITAPGAPQTMSLVVNVSSSAANTTEKAWAQTSYTIVVVRPIVLSALVKNESNITLEGIDVRFFVDGEFVGSVKESFPPLESKRVQFEWVVKGVSPGGHKATVEVDLDGDGVADPAKGEVVSARIFYREYEGPNYILPAIILLIILSALVAIFLVKRQLRLR